MARADVERFAEIVQRPDVDIELDRAALLVGAWEYDDSVVERELDHYRTLLDGIAVVARRHLALIDELPRAGARALGRTLFVELGFHGNTADYYDPRNSFLREVLDRRTGIPITLGVVYMEVARRIGIRATGVGFPGHFLVRVHGGDDALVIDPFNGGAALSGDDLGELLRRVVGPEAQLEPSLLEPTSNRQILTRMLLNLAGIYGRQGDLFRSLEVLERLHVLDTDNPRIQRELDSLRRRVDGLN